MSRKQIKSFDVFQTSKIVALLYFVFIALIMIPFAVISFFMGGSEQLGIPEGGGFIFIALPFIYALIIFIVTAIACLVYNYFSSKIGGIVVEVQDEATKDA